MDLLLNSHVPSMQIFNCIYIPVSRYILHLMHVIQFFFKGTVDGEMKINMSSSNNW